RPAVAAAPTPGLFAGHAEVTAAIESSRLEDAAATLATAPDMADVHFLRARLAEAKLESGTAYQEIKLSVAASPDYAEYQYELGVIAGMPRQGESLEAEASRFAEGGVALDRALTLVPDD